VAGKVVARVSALLCLVLWTWASAQAQNVNGAPALAPNSAVVSGFSGGVTLPRDADHAETVMINLDGPVLRAINVNGLGGPFRGQAVTAAKPFTVTARQIGQVYAVTFDDAVPPNIYAAATSVYGLPIVVPEARGMNMPERVRRGAPNVRFMPGLFGPLAGAGPGSIWKISGTDGAVSLFANVTLDGTANSGAALGGLAFDSASRRIYVADRGSGTIHSFNLQGVDAGRFDHATQALPLAGLPSVPFDPSLRADIRSLEFDSGDPATWGYAPPARRVFGLAVHRGRLYYAVAAGPAVWSVSLSADGGFGGDPRVEFAFQAGPVPVAEISKIVFDASGDMLLAERGMPTGAYDFGVLVRPDSGRVLRLKAQRPGVDGTPYLWQAVGEYATGFAGEHRNGDGGIALGSGYDRNGVVDPGECGGTLWITGSRLRTTGDPALAQRLAPSGPLGIDGLQGSPVAQLRPNNTPPWSSLFIDFDDATDSAGASGRTPSQTSSQALGHMGDVAVWRMCPGPLFPQLAELLSEEPCPAGFHASRNQCVPAPCAAGELYRGGVCDKPECRPGERFRDGSCCPADSKWNPGTRTCDRKRPDLAIKKELAQCAPDGGPCTFRITLTNDSDVPYTGPILVGNTIKPGVVQSMTSPPGWACGQVSGQTAPLTSGPASDQAAGAIWACVAPDATLGPNQSAAFSMTAAVPLSPPRWLSCAAVKGDAGKDAGGGNNKSCVKGGDDAPGERGAPDLVARTSLRSCSAGQCEFVIAIRNIGTADYKGDLQLSETIEGGTIAGLVPFETGWSMPCAQGESGLICRRPNTSLAPGDPLTIGVSVTFAPGVRILRNCAIVDRPAGDANPDNDGSCVELHLEDLRPRLVVEKASRAGCGRLITAGGGSGNWSCEFEIAVTNMSPVPFNGDIKVTDTIAPGSVVWVSGDAADCPNYGGSLLCQWFNKALPPGGSTRITVRVDLPPNLPFESCARLDAPASAEQACISGMPAEPPPRREGSRPDPICAGGAFLVRPPSGVAQCCTLRSVAAGTCAGGRAVCADGTNFNLRTGSCDRKETCAADARLRDGTCCPAGQKAGSDGRCQAQLSCRSDQVERDGECVDGPISAAQGCPADRTADASSNTCVCRSGREVNGVCMTPATVAECPRGQIRQFDRCCTPEAIAAGACGGAPPPSVTLCPSPLLAFGGRCCTREEIGTGRCAAPARGCARGQYRGDDGRCYDRPARTERLSGRPSVKSKPEATKPAKKRVSKRKQQG
jgi:hypothetical protein